jgi:hypothetical protein
VVPLLAENFADHESVVPGRRFRFFLAALPGRSQIKFVQVKFRPESAPYPARDAIMAQIGNRHQMRNDPLRKLSVVERQALQKDQVRDFTDFLPTAQPEKREKRFCELIGGIDSTGRENESSGRLQRWPHVGSRYGFSEKL